MVHDYKDITIVGTQYLTHTDIAGISKPSKAVVKRETLMHYSWPKSVKSMVSAKFSLTALIKTAPTPALTSS